MSDQSGLEKITTEKITTDKIKLAAAASGRHLTDEQAAVLQAFIRRLGSLERAREAVAALSEVERAA